MDSRTKSLCDFLNAAHSVYHAQAYLAEALKNAGYTRLYEQDEWALAPGGKYFLTRGGSCPEQERLLRLHRVPPKHCRVCALLLLR